MVDASVSFDIDVNLESLLSMAFIKGSKTFITCMYVAIFNIFTSVILYCMLRSL